MTTTAIGVGKTIGDAGRLRNRAQTANAVSIIPIVSTIPIKTRNYTADATVQGYIARYYRVLLHNTNPTCVKSLSVCSSRDQGPSV